MRKRSGHGFPLRSNDLLRYLAGALSVGGLPERFRSGPVGAEDGGICGRAGAAPVVIPGSVLARGDDGAFWAVEDAGEVAAWSVDELFRP